MILTLFVVLVAIALVLIIIGLSKPTESAQALIGFFFLFLLSFIILGGDLEYSTGFNSTTILHYNESAQGPNVDYLLTSTHEENEKLYTSFSGILSRRYGYYLAIASAIGFIGCMFSVAKTKWGKKEE